MKKISLALTFFVLVLHLAHAQKQVRFVAEASTDSVLMGHYFELSFLLENGNARNFSLPELDPSMEIVSGPNTSSSFSMVNGESSQKMRYSLVIRPAQEGTFTIPPASAEVEGKKMETAPIQIYVGPNPEGIPQPQPSRQSDVFRMDFGDFFGRDLPTTPSLPREIPAKKRKTVKI